MITNVVIKVMFWLSVLSRLDHVSKVLCYCQLLLSYSPSRALWGTSNTNVYIGSPPPTCQLVQVLCLCL